MFDCWKGSYQDEILIFDIGRPSKLCSKIRLRRSSRCGLLPVYGRSLFLVVSGARNQNHSWQRQATNSRHLWKFCSKRETLEDQRPGRKRLRLCLADHYIPFHHCAGQAEAKVNHRQETGLIYGKVYRENSFKLSLVTQTFLLRSDVIRSDRMSNTGYA